MVHLRIWGTVGIACVAAACGSSSSGSLFNTTGGSAGQGGTAGTSGGAGGSGGATGGTAGTATGGSAGAAGSNTGGTSGTGATGGGGTGGAPKDAGSDAPVCTPTVAAVDHIVAEIYAAYDDSGSMWEPVPGTGNGTKWSEASAAFDTFVSDPLSKNLFIELSFMPPVNQNLNDCLVASYSPPDVPFGQLGAGTAQAIQTALSPIVTGGASPWYGAMQAALPAATAEAQAHLERDVSILFLADWVGATDCNPSGTPVGQDSAPTAQLAGQALAGTPSIRTWVIGLSNVSTDVSYFDPISAAGGTNKALFPQPPNQTNVLASLQVMHYAVDCEFRLPEVKGAPPVAGSFDLRVQSNGPHALSEVSGEAACTPDGWWSVGPRRVHFCKQACDLVLGDANAKVELQTKCK